MRILLIDNGTYSLKHLKTALRGNKIITHKWNDIHFPLPKEIDLIILSGGHHFPVVGHPREWKNEVELIRKTKVPTIGICLGFELIAHAFGGKLKQHPKSNKKIISIKWTNKKLFPRLKQLRVYEHHRWTLSRTPKGFETLARSSDGIEGINHRTRPLIGFQFHPEIMVNARQRNSFLQRIIIQLKEKNSPSIA